MGIKSDDADAADADVSSRDRATAKLLVKKL